MSLLDTLGAWAGEAQGAVFEAVVQPVLFSAGFMAYAEPAYDATFVVLLGLLEIALLYAILRPLEALRPAEGWPDRHGVGTDVLYTFLHRLGFLPLLAFALLAPVEMVLDNALRGFDVIPPTLEQLVPPLAASPLLAFLAYLVVLDLVEYWIHRLQHRWNWWWSLHALHHSQRRLSFWADNRNHLLDDLLRAIVLAALARAIGVPPAQFVTLVVATRAVESLAHANVRLSFGTIGERLLVSPRFHRLHHSIGEGHEGGAGGHNFAVLFPVWDALFGTALRRAAYPPTGIRDQLAGRDYGEGFWRQQWLGLVRLREALRAPRRPRQNMC